MASVSARWAAFGAFVIQQVNPTAPKQQTYEDKTDEAGEKRLT